MSWAINQYLAGLADMVGLVVPGYHIPKQLSRHWLSS